MAKKPQKDTSPFKLLVAWHPGASTAEDGTDATSVIEYAAWLARTTDVCIRVVSTFVRPWPATSLSKMGGKYKKWHSKEAEACEAEVKKALSAAGIDKKYWDEQVSEFRDGTSEAGLIVKAAHDFEADLILMNGTDAAPKSRLLSGTTVDNLLNSSAHPLGMIPHTARLSKRGVTRINYGFVDGEQNNSVLLHAAKLATEWDVPLRVIAFAPELVEDTAAMITPVTVDSEIKVQWREHLYATLDRAHDIVGAEFPNLEIETEVGSGRNWSTSVDAVKWKKGDLLYLASVPLGPIERVFVGSETSQLLHYAPVPVIIRPVS
ncbi:universal stress protein [Staphylococcus chromogenes]|nr:universal stress protein [Staphylococcus chromogenes]